ncbi:GNAT family N-acetyltransferase [Klebsiella sp. BIGb0407]|uniref:GNAT family N-acetyltransferase n=1 Tax=Klebsiella sp. BIGb0407 TaxID=2940603 RepID=UPI002168C330|nr:GNAT family N-acetyltransferase [Klebsiella sp. BIGb0407]MCS3429811.1 GNAT superfamily N-acetyltransferase [Klebsiella sp. BIGb0407]
MENKLGQDICIRRFTKSDMPAVLALISQIASCEDLTESAGQQFSNELDDPKHNGGRFVADLGDRLIGTMGCTQGPIPSKNVLWADWLIVDSDYRRYGIASLLYAEIEKYALKHEKTCLCLDIGNIDRERAAYRFHLRNGFQIVGQLPDYWGDFEHLNIMAKPLISKE